MGFGYNMEIKKIESQDRRIASLKYLELLTENISDSFFALQSFHFNLFSILFFTCWSTTVFNQPLYQNDATLSLKLVGDFKSIFKDRHDDAEYRDCEIEVNGENTKYGLKIKTRGHFRLTLGNCNYPPLLLNFSAKKTPAGSVFFGQNKIKLVLPCRGEQDLVEEMLVYKMYDLVSAHAFQVRKVTIDFIDHLGSIAEQVTGFLLEDEDQMATRVGAEIFKRDGLRGNKMNSENYLTMAVFQYFIGNTDWSTEYRHNIKLLRKNGFDLPIPVPYDFDHSGVVDAPYARPAQELNMRDVTERRFRGYCLEKLDQLNETLLKFEKKKEELFQLVEKADLGATNKLRLSSYLSQFYRNIADQKKFKRDFGYPCLKHGTGNVVIKGLK